MKELHLWECEKCHAQYETQQEAENCEKRHQIPQKIIRAHYQPITTDQTGYPFQIYVRFENGDSMLYERKY